MPDRMPALDLPQIAVPCPRCDAAAGDPCTSHSGTRPRRNDTHTDRTTAWARASRRTDEETH